MRPPTPDRLDLQAACREAAALKAAAKAERLKRARALLDEGMGLHGAARRAHVSVHVLRRAIQAEAAP